MNTSRIQLVADITLTGGVITIASGDTIEITSSAAAQRTLSADSASRVFICAGTLTLSWVTVADGNCASDAGSECGAGCAVVYNGGHLVLNYATFSNCYSEGVGGAMHVEGRVTATSSTFSNNRADCASGAGGGVFMIRGWDGDVEGVVSTTLCSFIGNDGDCQGGVASPHWGGQWISSGDYFESNTASILGL